nr:glycosyltransferase family 2 protein [uncultured Paracoccus sp.]
MHPRVSVILPTYNRTRTLGDAMASVLGQSFTDLELIVVDDGSTENVQAVVSEQDDGRVRYVRRLLNEGAAAARNTGIALARGAFVAFQDSDDLWLPGKLARQVERLDSLPGEVGAITGPKILVGRNERFVYGEGLVCLAPAAETPLCLEEDQVGHLLRENRISVQCSLFRREALGDGPYFDRRARANEDWEFAIRLAQRTKIVEDREPVLLGFVSDDSISRSRRRETLGVLRILKANEQLLSFYPRQRSALWLEVGRQLAESGKPRLANRAILRALRADPEVALGVARAVLRRVAGPLRRARNRPFGHRSA